MNSTPSSGAVTPDLLAHEQLRLLQPEVLLADQLCVVCADVHPLARRRRLAWSALATANWVAPPKDTLVRQALMTAFLNQGLEPPEPAVEVLSSVTVGSLLRLDPALLGAVRLEHAQDELARGGIRRLAVEPVVPLPSLGLYTRRSAQPLPTLVRSFADALRRFGKKGASDPPAPKPAQASKL